MIHHVATLDMVGYAILPFAQDLKNSGTVPEFLGDSYQNGADKKTNEEFEGANRYHGDLPHGITNSETERINSKIMSIKRRAGGYRNIGNFKTAVSFYCGGLDLDPRYCRMDNNFA
jgi:transposase